MSKVYVVMENKECGNIICTPRIEKIFKSRKRAVKYIFDAWNDKIVSYIPGENKYYSMNGDVKTTRYVEEFMVE